MSRGPIKLRPDEWYGVAGWVDDELAFHMASVRLGAPPEKLELRASPVVKLFRIMEDEMFDVKITGSVECDGLRRRCKQQEKEIIALRQLATGCRDHPNYRGQRKPRTKCETCLALHQFAKKYLKW